MEIINSEVVRELGKTRNS